MAFYFQKRQIFSYHCKRTFIVKAVLRCILFIFFLLPLIAIGQPRFSVSTDLSIMHNFDGRQPFTVPGQSIGVQWHPDEKYSVYSYFTYHLKGKYVSRLEARAKQTATQPQSFQFTNRSEMRLLHLSIGVKKFLTGSFRNMDELNVYISGGFGLLMGEALNNFSVAIDTGLYNIQDNVIGGSGDFKRLSFDLSAGVEYPVGYAFFLFSEARMLIPTTDYPSSYLLKNNNAPFLGSINIGVRILFNDEQD